jgi:hypothetical protein
MGCRGRAGEEVATAGPCGGHQVRLLPSLDNWLTQHHLARFVADLAGVRSTSDRFWLAAPESAASAVTAQVHRFGGRGGWMWGDVLSDRWRRGG